MSAKPSPAQELRAAVRFLREPYHCYPRALTDPVADLLEVVAADMDEGLPYVPDLLVPRADWTAALAVARSVYGGEM